MCHPGHPDAELAGLDPVVERRRMEYDALMRDPGAAAAHLAARAQRRRAAARLVASCRTERMAAMAQRLAPGGQHPVRHGLALSRFGRHSRSPSTRWCSKLLTALLGMHPIVARLAAISLAMVAGWLMHRTFTFAVTTPPSVAEFLRYAAVGWTAAAINYGVFVLIVLARPAIEPLVALVVSSLVAMVFAYLGMRFAAFRRGRWRYELSLSAAGRARP